MFNRVIKTNKSGMFLLRQGVVVVAVPVVVVVVVVVAGLIPIQV